MVAALVGAAEVDRRLELAVEQRRSPCSSSDSVMVASVTRRSARACVTVRYRNPPSTVTAASATSARLAKRLRRMRRWLAATNERSSGPIVCWGTLRRVSSST
ncbi:MAG TPA: hypothetical protein VF516_32920, partial [Kofleriaceae bacterium]